MKTWGKVLIGIAIALVVLLVVAYFGMGYVIYDKLGNVKGRATSTWPTGPTTSPCTRSGRRAST